MSGMRKSKASLCAIDVQKDHLKLTRPWPQEWLLTDLPCGFCSLSFKPAGAGALSDLGRLEIKLTSPSSWWCTAERSLHKALSRVLSMRRDFVVVYDFLGQEPTELLVESVGRFRSENKEFRQRMKFAALLIQDNIFVAAPVISGFIKACATGCPFLVCHGRTAADEFFKLGLSDLSEDEPDSARTRCPPDTFAPFVSIVDVRAASPDEAVSLCCTEAFSAAMCFASVAPLMPGSSPAAHAFHVLPNGDVRVIQSPSREFDPEVYCSPEDSARLVWKGPSGDDLSVTALKFDCAQEDLQCLVGAHFHLGELMVDAELQSVRRGSSVWSSGNLFGDFPPNIGCFAGVNTIIGKIVGPLVLRLLAPIKGHHGL